MNDESVIETLNHIHPKLGNYIFLQYKEKIIQWSSKNRCCFSESQLLLAKQVALIEPLKDLAAHETDTTFLSPEYRYKTAVLLTAVNIF